MVVPREVNSAYWILRLGFGIGLLAAGADKFRNFLADWEAYLSPTVQSMLPVASGTFMQFVGVVEMIVGVVILAGATRLFGYIGMLWMFAIAANLVLTNTYYDIALRDILLGMGALSLARLTEARSRVVETVPYREEHRRAA